MRTDYPSVIIESVEALRAAEQRVRGERVAPRARMLVLLKTGAAPTLAACAALLGYSPRGVARWWASYRRDGLAALLRQRPRRGRQPRLTAPALAGLEAVLAAGAVATLQDARRYLAEEWDIVYPSLNGVWHHLHKHRIKKKTGRRRHQRADAAAQAALRAGFRPDPGGQPGDRGVALDEARFGLRSDLRRRWCPRGVRPPWLVNDQDQWRWLYAAVEPTTGRSVFCYLPGVTKEWFALFLAQLGQAVGAQRAVVVLDNASSHRATITWPPQLTPLPLPAYSPELNPAEQVFRVLRARLANRIYADLAALDAALTEQLQGFWDQPAVLHQLTAYPWWTTGVDAMMSGSP